MRNSDYNYRYNSLNFKARNVSLRKADDICRRTMNEFPVYLSTRLKGYSTIAQEKNLYDFYEGMISCVRQYYISADTANGQLFRELSAMKQQKTGNCAELADASYVALKMNGFKDVERVSLFAYNPKEKTMRDLDHIATMVNLDLPQNYTYCPLSILNSKNGPSSEYRVYPKKDTIIVDSWCGMTDYASNMKQIYNHNSTLIKNTEKKGQIQDTLLKKGEELCYVPVSDGIYLNPMDYSYLNGTYKGLVKPANKKNIPQIDYSQSYEYNLPYISKYRINCIRYEYGMKNAPSKNDYEVAKKMCIYETFGIYPVDEKPVKKSLLDKTIALFKRIF